MTHYDRFEYREAHQLFRQGLKLAPEHPELQHFLTMTCLLASDHSPCPELNAGWGTVSHPEAEAEAHLDEAKALAARGLVSQAASRVEAARRALRRDPFDFYPVQERAAHALIQELLRRPWELGTELQELVGED